MDTEQINDQKPVKNKTSIILIVVIMAIVAVVVGFGVWFIVSNNNKPQETVAVKEHRQRINILEKEVMDNPQNVSARFNLGSSYYAVGKKQESINQFQQAIKIDGKNVSYHNAIANAFRDTGNEEQAIHHYQKAIDLDKKYQNAYINLGLMHVKSKRFDDAVKVFDLAINNLDNKVDMFRHKAIALEKSGKKQEAIKTLEGAKNDFPEDKPLDEMLKRLKN